MRWLASITKSTYMNLSKLRETVKDRGAWHATVHARLLRPWYFLGKNTGVGCHFLLQRIFPTQGSNPGLLHHRQILYRLSHQGSLGVPRAAFTLEVSFKGDPHATHTSGWLHNEVSTTLSNFIILQKHSWNSGKHSTYDFSFTTKDAR